MSWHGCCIEKENTLSIKELIEYIQKQYCYQPWLERQSYYCYLKTTEVYVSIDTTETTKPNDWLLLKPTTCQTILKVSDNIILLVIPHISWIVTPGHLFYRFNSIEQEMIGSKQQVLRDLPLWKYMEKILIQNRASMKHTLACLLQLAGQFLEIQWKQWKMEDYTCQLNHDGISNMWLEGAQQWTRTYHSISKGINKLTTLITYLFQQDSTLIATPSCSAVTFLEQLSSRNNELIHWRRNVDHVEQLIPLSFRQKETLLLKIDLPIVTGTALLGFCLLVMGLTCMNFTIPPYNYSFALKIWAVFVSLLVLLLLTGFTSVFLWLRQNAISTKF